MIDAPASDRSVFINCPYDQDYVPILQAIVLGIVCSGFMPRSAIDSGEAAQLRLDRIISSLRDSRYSVHDLSRCKGEGAHGLARFNMPLELGMAIAFRHALPDEHRDMLTLVPADHEYARFVSDLAGMDPGKHDGQPITVLKRVMSWLASHAKEPTPEPPAVAARLGAFAAKWVACEDTWGQLRWSIVVQEATTIARSLD